MNILIVAQRIPYPPNKGEKIRTFNQAKYLAELGHNIDVFAPVENEKDKNDAATLSNLKSFDCHYSVLTSKPIRLAKGLLTNQALSVSNFYSTQLQQQIDDSLVVKQYDVILCTCSAVAKYLFKSKVLVTMENKPILIMDYMDLDSDKWRQYSDKSSGLMKLIYRREAQLVAQYEHKIQQYFDACFFIADTEVELFKSNTPNSNIDNIYTLGNGLDTSEFYPPKRPPTNQSPKFIFTGVMDYKPNVDAVVWFIKNCWSRVIKKYPKAEFIIAGMNPNSTIQELEKYQGITVTGFVDDILPYYHQADYFIAPFRLARGVQNKVLQAFACGLPVISTPMGAEGISCQDNTHILLADSPEQFLKKIDFLERNPSFKSSITQAAIELIQQSYSWASKLEPLEQLLALKTKNKNEKIH